MNSNYRTKSKNSNITKTIKLSDSLKKFSLTILLTYAIVSILAFLFSFFILINYFYDMKVKSIISNYSALLSVLERQYKIEFEIGYTKFLEKLESIYDNLIKQIKQTPGEINKNIKEAIGAVYPRLGSVENVEKQFLNDTLYGYYIIDYLQKSKRNVDFIIYNIYYKDYYTKIFFIKLGDQISLFKTDQPYYLETFSSFVNLRKYNDFIKYIDVFAIAKNKKNELARHLLGTLDEQNERNKYDKDIITNVEIIFKEEKEKIISNFISYWNTRYDSQTFKEKSSLSNFKVIKSLKEVRGYTFLNLQTEYEIGDPIIGIVVLDFSNLVNSVLYFIFFLIIFTGIAVFAVLKKEEKFVNDINTTFSNLTNSFRTFGRTKIFTEDMVNFNSNISEIQEILEEYIKVAQELTAAYEEQIALTQQLEASYKEIEYSHNQLEKSYLEFASQLAIIAENYDENTGSHIIRVAKLSRFIAEKIGCNGELLDKLEKFAPLHDIGKVLIPKEILLKNGPLTDEEFEIMKKHAIFGAKLIGDNPNLEIAKNIALYHHERYDGTGYPYGLKGEDIPFEARVVAIVDVYDALRSDRPYKKSFSHEKSIEILLKGDRKTQPTHFDPKILATFAQYETEIKKLWDEISNTKINIDG